MAEKRLQQNETQTGHFAASVQVKFELELQSVNYRDKQAKKQQIFKS